MKTETSSEKKLPRWKKGGERYGRQDQNALKAFRSVDGWRNGAKVSKR